MKNNGRGGGKQTFVRALHAIFDHPDYIGLSKTSRAFLWDFMRQYNGFNNGNLSGAPAIMGKYGWDKKTGQLAYHYAVIKGFDQLHQTFIYADSAEKRNCEKDFSETLNILSEPNWIWEIYK